MFTAIQLGQTGFIWRCTYNAAQNTIGLKYTHLPVTAEPSRHCAKWVGLEKFIGLIYSAPLRPLRP